MSQRSKSRVYQRLMMILALVKSQLVLMSAKIKPKMKPKAKSAKSKKHSRRK